jgi:thiol-disulfide isomerase/thioredoxin
MQTVKTFITLLGFWGVLITSAGYADTNQADKDAIMRSVKEHDALVVFWRVDCPPCIDELRVLPKIAKAHPDLKIALVSLMERTTADQYLTNHLPQNVLNLTINQTSKELLAAFGNQRAILPYSVRLHKDGQICQTHIGILGTSLVNQWGKTC